MNLFICVFIQLFNHLCVHSFSVCLVPLLISISPSQSIYTRIHYISYILHYFIFAYYLFVYCALVSSFLHLFKLIYFSTFLFFGQFIIVKHFNTEKNKSHENISPLSMLVAFVEYLFPSVIKINFKLDCNFFLFLFVCLVRQLILAGTFGKWV